MYNELFNEYFLANILLKNRILMAPMTRSRSLKNCVANEIMAKYYAQRASAGLIITEATQVSLQGQGYARTPGIYSKEQIEGWKLTTEAIHKKGGKIFLQLWHVGRVSSSKVNGLQPVAPSNLIAKDTQVYVFDGLPNGDATMIPVEQPKELTQNEIKQTISDFAQGAKNSIEAGFDGVEIHGANGYLIDQFLRSNSNIREDNYGGSKEKRIKFLLEVTKAVVDKVGKERVGVRLSPFIKMKDMNDAEILETIMLAAKELDKIGIAYIHLCEADWGDAPKVTESWRVELRDNYSGSIIATGNKTPQEGENLIKAGLIDIVGFGRNFISNPDYVERIKYNYELSPIKYTKALFGGGGELGYSDYPNYQNK